MQESFTLTIDGQQVAVQPGTTVLEAAAQLGIEIPTFCHHAKLMPIGACRMCLVEVEKVRAPQPACSTPARPDMVVLTNTPAIVKARRAQLEFLLTNHPLDCPVCDAGGACELQDQCFAYGQDDSRYIELRRHKAKALPLNDNVIMDQERCVLCRRCLRFMQEWADEGEIDLIERGRESFVDTFNREPFTSIFSGNTVQICPVGALTSRKFRFRARVWELERTDSICLNCAVGCNIEHNVKTNELKRIVSRPNPDVNDEWLCDRGRFDHSFADPAGRVVSPLIREDGVLKPATWERALEVVAERLGGIAADQGGHAIAAIGSARASNEANYLLQRLARAGLHTNNVAMTDAPPAHARLLPSNRVFDQGGVALVVGIDMLQEAPVLELLARHAALRGSARFVVLHTEPSHLTRFGSWLGCRPGTEVAVLNGMARLMIDKNLAQRVANLDNLRTWVASYTPANVERMSGVSAEALEAAVQALAGAPHRLILYGGSAARNPELLKAVANLALLSHADGPAFIPAQANAIGALDMGMHPASLPGFQSYEDKRVVDRLLQLWGGKLPRQPGLAMAQMSEAIQNGALQAAYVLGRPPAEVAGVPFLVVQTSRLEDVTDDVSVVLPASSYAETEGTYTNLNGRVQLALQAQRPLRDSQPDWWILMQLGRRLGKPSSWALSGPAAVFSEIAKGVPAYGGLNYEQLLPHGRLRSLEGIQLRLTEANAVQPAG